MAFIIITLTIQILTLMAVDFMVQPEQLLSRFLLVLALLFLGCKSKENHQPVFQILELTKGDFNNINGIIYCNNKPFNGKNFTLYPNSADTAQTSTYLAGIENGVWKKFYPKGKTQEIRTFDRGKKVGEYIAYWENGNKKLDYLFENDEYEGTCREWNFDGMLIKEMNYTKGHENGSQKMFYNNGKARSNYVIKNGRRYGLLGTKNCINATDSLAFKP